jgi:hypothetical protein
MASGADDVVMIDRDQQQDEALLRSNPYGNLSDVQIEDDEWQTLNNKNNKKRKFKQSPTRSSQPPKMAKPPPIVLIGIEVVKIHAHLKTIAITDYNLKLTGEGTKTFTNHLDDYRKVKNSLIDNNIHFFTHQLKEDQLAKFVLSGLHKMPVSEVLKALTDAGKPPKAVKEMRTKQANRILYLVYFLKQDRVKLEDLQKIGVVNYMRVTWSHFRNKRTGPTQCSRCLRFGHSTSNCHALARCIRCAKPHASNDCPLIKNGDGPVLKQVDVSLLRCIHCGLQHTANYSGCKKRLELIKSRLAASHNTRPTQHRNQKSFVPAFQLENANFPSIPSRPVIGAWSAQARPTQSRPEPQFRPQQPNHNETNVNNNNNKNQNAPRDAAQLFTIFTEMVTQLASATTFESQINAMMQIALKYIAPINVV